MTSFIEYHVDVRRFKNDWNWSPKGVSLTNRFESRKDCIADAIQSAKDDWGNPDAIKVFVNGWQVFPEVVS